MGTEDRFSSGVTEMWQLSHRGIITYTDKTIQGDLAAMAKELEEAQKQSEKLQSI